jgi:hypothetical protein
MCRETVNSYSQVDSVRALDTKPSGATSRLKPMDSMANKQICQATLGARPASAMVPGNSYRSESILEPIGFT